MALNRTPIIRSQTTAAADQLRRAGDAQQNASAKEGARQAQRATTYNGTLFTNTNQAQNNNQGSRKFASLQRNKRRANDRARRNAARGAGGGDEDGGGEVKNNDMDALNGGRGGGGGGRGREQEQQDDTQIEAMGGKAGADAQASGARPASAQAAPASQLDAIAAKFETGHEMQRAEAVRNAWHESIRQLFETAGNGEAGPWSARLSALIVNLLQIEMKIGSVGAGGILALKDLAQHAGKGMGSESFHHILPLAMLRASYKAGKARRERGGAIQQSVGAGIVARSRKKASGGDGQK
ncbi:hypothetical protein ACS0ZG_13650 [Burkholderia gladioli]|uniref:hypothetical protein n=1 Tax=Burkholderia gladioli TaxID=28095 RepID=UPI00163F3154|nr:hypothetical protein [Burkholderia gladioli]MDA0571480.1 hypothetical protein [Burkholderia gladioli]MDA0599382.1 hypothetical protein [Burkholderia gladioli]